MAHRCVKWGLSGFLLTLAWQAWAQDGAVMIDPTTSIVVELVKGGGLPAVVGLIAYFAGRGNGFTLTIGIAQPAMALLERGVRAIEDLKPKGG
jgi:p-aminobenzoyl-glutamate transporter AbgT